MSEKRASRKTGRRWLMIGVAAGVVVLLLAAFMVMDYATSAGRQQPMPPPATSGSIGQPLAGITVGSGGTKTGADGVTKIGYAGSCDGAVQAATNYKKGLTDVFVVSDEKKVAFINQVVLPGPTRDSLLDDAKRRLEVLKTDGGKEIAKGFTQTTHVEWGGAYRISDCTAERTAAIQLLSCKVTTFGGDPFPPAFDCSADIVRLLWSGEDWKAVSLDDWGPAGYLLNITDKIPGWEPTAAKLPIPVAIRDAYLLNSVTGAKDEGWVDYAGITRQ